MALFNKLFFSSSNSKRKSLNTTGNQQIYLSKFPFDPKQVRIILYRECDSRGRRLLFDSSSIQKISLNESVMTSSSTSSMNGNNNNTHVFQSQQKQQQQSTMNKKNLLHKCRSMSFDEGFVDISNGFIYKHCRPNASDITNIGEMVFGALAMSFRGSALKIHWLNSPSRLLCSQVFLSPVSSNNLLQCNLRNNVTRQSMSSGNGSVSGFSIDTLTTNSKSKNSNLISCPLDVPDNNMQTNKIPREISEYDDSGYSETNSSSRKLSEATTTSPQIAQTYQYTKRNSSGSVVEPSEYQRKLSLDSVGSDFDMNFSSVLPPSTIHSECIQRRISRNQMTSFENRDSSSDIVGFISDNSQTATNGGSDNCVSLRYAANRRISEPNESRSNPEFQRRNVGLSSENTMDKNESWLNIFGGGNTVRSSGRRAKLGLAVCITLTETFEKEMEKFICEHIALLESMLCRLRASAENAYVNHKQFFHIMLQAWQSSTEWIKDLLVTPRLPSPIWLSLNTGESRNYKSIAENFMKEFCCLLKTADTKDTNFFISTILTAILTHHLGWVSTICGHDKEFTNDMKNNANEKNSLLEISNHHPYNALWAQLVDLYGAIGNPSKISRTIIHGTEKNLIEKLLSVLSYFIRCGEVQRSDKNLLLDKKTITKTVSEYQVQPKQKSGLTRSTTYHRNLNEMKNEINDNDINVKLKNKENIKLTITTPENIDSVVEAIEIPFNTSTTTTTTSIVQFNCKSKSRSLAKKIIWNLKPDVEEGLSLNDLEKLQYGVQLINKKLERSSSCLAIEPLNIDDVDDSKKVTSLTDLVIAENLCWKNTQQLIDDCKTNVHNLQSNEKNNVVFVLGDNEKLVNIKKSHEDIPKILAEFSQTAVASTSTASSKNHIPREKHVCNHHKKHSGVKFNFEQYPQIATNYMKNKNIDLTNYDFHEKSTKLNDNSSEIITDEKSFHFKAAPKLTNSAMEICEYCNTGIAKLYQTPSNATDFESDDNSYLSEPLIKTEKNLSKIAECDDQNKDHQQEQHNQLKYHSYMNFIQLPVPVIGQQNDGNLYEINNKTGFIPSLFVGINDHYIPDMVLQATSAPPHTWEDNLKNDLTLSSHCASLVSVPMENIAIVADMKNWEVKIISSQTQMLPYSTAASGPVGVSQLVLTMLETVYAMNDSGISAYECLAFIEVKLKELYVQSQTLAAFLLATEFCTLNTVTSALNLSENDVPLLLSVASTHTPQVTKKYGISFR